MMLTDAGCKSGFGQQHHPRIAFRKQVLLHVEERNPAGIYIRYHMYYDHYDRVG
jgi:hypothetical protein